MRYGILSLSLATKPFYTGVRWIGTYDKPVLTLFTKKYTPCSLCEEAKEVLSAHSSQFQYEEKYIDEPSNKEWAEKYKWEIPVLHLNGSFLMKNKVDEELLKKALEEVKSRGHTS